MTRAGSLAPLPEGSTPSRRPWRRWLLTAVSIAIVAALAFRFPWHRTLDAILSEDPRLLAAAFAVNLLSLVAKGWAWQLLLRPGARWRTAQEATLAGAAVTNVSVSVTGEAARIAYMVSRDGLPLTRTISAVALSRTLEGIALFVFLVAAPLLIDMPTILHRVHVFAVVALGVTLLLAAIGRRLPLPKRLRAAARELAQTLHEHAGPAWLAWPSVLAMVNWATQWATFWLALAAFHVPHPAGASFTALVLTNLSGVPRISPGNVGVFQGALVVALIPFGVSASRAVAAGLAIQALQILPVQAAAMILFGWRGLVSTPKMKAAKTQPE
jgi:uncharacterized membrane protein YbhN (UPF0104 family)